MAWRAVMVKTQISTAGKINSSNNGYAYLMMLVMVASIGLFAAVLGVLIFSRDVRVEKESELLFRGVAYMNAIKSYYAASAGTKAFPQKLEDLLSDSRFPEKHHIRKLYKDPVTGGDWTLITGANGEIYGVASKSKTKPIKQKDFPSQLKSFEGAEHYSDWVFICRP
jgi:type II secretory pathway pseudopilin PulG